MVKRISAVILSATIICCLVGCSSNEDKVLIESLTNQLEQTTASMAEVQTELDEALIELDTLKVTLANAEQRIIELEGLLVEENTAKEQYEQEQQAEEQAAANNNSGGSSSSTPSTPPSSSGGSSSGGGSVVGPPAGETMPGQGGKPPIVENPDLGGGNKPGDEGVIVQ